MHPRRAPALHSGSTPRERVREIADCVEALFFLAVSRTVVRLFPFSTVVRWIGKAPNARQGPDVAVNQSILAIERVERRIFWDSRCLDRGMALQHMLRRRGVASQLVYGLANDPKALRAHVWIDVGGSIVMGAAESPDYREVARFPLSLDRLSSG